VLEQVPIARIGTPTRFEFHPFRMRAPRSAHARRAHASPFPVSALDAACRVRPLEFLFRALLPYSA